MGRHIKIEVRYPEGGEPVPVDNDKEMIDLIRNINAKYGLSMPILAFGFSQFNRGVSIWSEDRVVTHEAVLRGQGYNITESIQSLGRACYQGKHILKKNGFNHVTVLTAGSDYDLAFHADAFINRFFDEIEKTQLPFLTVMKSMHPDLAKAFPEEANVFRSTNRHLSPNKKHKNVFEETISFEGATELTPGEQELGERYLNNPRVQRFMRTLIDLNNGDPGELFNATMVKDRFDYMWEEYDTIKKAGREGVCDLLNTFTRKGKLGKVCNDANKKNPSYRVKDEQVFKMLLNPDDDFLYD